jgi:hypothetical protein
MFFIMKWNTNDVPSAGYQKSPLRPVKKKRCAVFVNEYMDVPPPSFQVDAGTRAG